MTVIVQDQPAVVVVEDMVDTLKLMRRILDYAAVGLAIITVPDAEAALSQLTQRPVRLLVTDYNMPGMDGLELAAAYKALSPSTRIIMITAYASPELERRARAQRIDYFLPKPFPIDQIEEIVLRVLSRP